MSGDSHNPIESDAEAYQAFHAEGLRHYEEILRHDRVVPAEAMWVYLRALIAGDNPAPPETVTLLQKDLSVLRAFEGFYP
jgi:hypothetical protein